MAPARLKKKLLDAGRRKSNIRMTKKKTVAKKKNKKKSSTPKKIYARASSRKNNVPVLPVADNNKIKLNNNNGPTVPLEAKVEFSPNGMAKCKSCFKKVEKKSKRFGIPLWSPRFNQEIYCYYHLQCCPEHIRNTIPNIRQKLSQQEQIENEKVHTLHYRQELVQSLKILRLMFANRLKVSPCLVFSNDVLNEIVFVLPDTQHELLSNVRGIGPTKLKSFGSAILSLIRQYNTQQKEKRIQIAAAAASKNGRKKKPHTTNNNNNNNNPKRKKDPPPQVIVIDDSDDDNNDNYAFDYQRNANSNNNNNDDDDDDDDDEEEEEIAIGATLTCEQLVKQKFDHAAKNGYIIAIDI